jgi:hypothetical protein
VNDKANSEALGVAVGHSGNEFGVPLTDDGLTITHYGLHSWTTLERETWWKGEAYPGNTGYSNAQINAVRNKLIISTMPADTDPVDHFNTVLQANSLELFEQQ